MIDINKFPNDNQQGLICIDPPCEIKENKILLNNVPVVEFSMDIDSKQLLAVKQAIEESYKIGYSDASQKTLNTKSPDRLKQQQEIDDYNLMVKALQKGWLVWWDGKCWVWDNPKDDTFTIIKSQSGISDELREIFKKL